MITLDFTLENLLYYGCHIIYSSIISDKMLHAIISYIIIT